MNTSIGLRKKLLGRAVATAACLLVVSGCSKENPTQPVSEYQSMEAKVLSLVNQDRISAGLPTLVSNDVIATEARMHSEHMAAGIVPFSHDGFSSRVDAIRKTMSLSNAGENVAFNSGFSDPAQQAVTQWLNSPGHKSNIEGNYNLTGIGIAKNASGAYFFTQIFAKSP